MKNKSRIIDLQERDDICRLLMRRLNKFAEFDLAEIIEDITKAKSECIRVNDKDTEEFINLFEPYLDILDKIIDFEVNRLGKYRINKKLRKIDSIIVNEEIDEDELR